MAKVNCGQKKLYLFSIPKYKELKINGYLRKHPLFLSAGAVKCKVDLYFAFHSFIDYYIELTHLRLKRAQSFKPAF